MDSKEFKEIMEALKELSIDQAVLKEKVEAHLKNIDKHDEELEEVTKLVGRHDIFMRASIWVVGIIMSVFGVKIFNSGG